MNLIADIPINNLSFGNVGINILKELYKRNFTVSLFPRGATDLSSFNKLDEDFKSWIERSTNDRYKTLDKDTPTLTLWHLNGSDRRISSKQFLLTFYELENPTFTEKKLVNFQDHTFLTNRSAIEAFKSVGCENISYVPLGFDPDFVEHQGEKKSVEGKTHFVLMGK